MTSSDSILLDRFIQQDYWGLVQGKYGELSDKSILPGILALHRLSLPSHFPVGKLMSIDEMQSQSFLLELSTQFFKTNSPSQNLLLMTLLYQCYPEDENKWIYLASEIQPDIATDWELSRIISSQDSAVSWEVRREKILSEPNVTPYFRELIRRVDLFKSGDAIQKTNYELDAHALSIIEKINDALFQKRAAQLFSYYPQSYYLAAYSRVPLKAKSLLLKWKVEATKFSLVLGSTIMRT